MAGRGNPLRALRFAVMTYPQTPYGQAPQQQSPHQPPANPWPAQPGHPQPGYPQYGYPPQGYQQPPPGYPPQPQRVVTSVGLSTTVHVLYAIGGFFTCGILWGVWIIHAVMAKKKVTTTIG